MKTKKVLLADDHLILRQGLIKIIEDDDDLFEIVAEVGDGLQALKKIKELKPDIAVLDISMPNMNGLEVAKKVQQEGIDVDIIILTMYIGKKYYQEAMNCGVKGYILKENSSVDLKNALKHVSSGKYFVSSILSDYLLENHREKRFLEGQVGIDDLSPSEKRILKLISENKTSKTISEELCLSFRTVQNHRAHICRKLDLEGMNALLQFAIENKSAL